MYLIEIYKSVQGESSFAGLPCIFVRLAGCNLRCSWCDSEYTFKGGYKQSLDEVEALLSLHDGQTCNSARAIAEHKLADVRQRIQDLSMLEAALAKLVQRCSTSKGKVSCPLIDALMDGGERTHDS